VHAFGSEEMRMKKWQQGLFVGLFKAITCEKWEQTLKKREVENLNECQYLNLVSKIILSYDNTIHQKERNTQNPFKMWIERI
jgi:hypothetical protein